MVEDAKLVALRGEPHGVLWTYSEEINTELVRSFAFAPLLFELAAGGAELRRAARGEGQSRPALLGSC